MSSLVMCCSAELGCDAPLMVDTLQLACSRHCYGRCVTFLHGLSHSHTALPCSPRRAHQEQKSRCANQAARDAKAQNTTVSILHVMDHKIRCWLGMYHNSGAILAYVKSQMLFRGSARESIQAGHWKFIWRPLWARGWGLCLAAVMGRRRQEA